MAKESDMGMAIMAVLCLLLLGYLFYTLFFPEKF